MNTTTIEAFPKSKLAAAQKAIAQAHGRLVRSAARAGQDAPAAPELVVLRERVASRCTICHATSEGWAGGKCLACGKGYMVTKLVLDLEVRCERPVLEGWEFLAVVEPLAGGNLIRKVPAAEVAEGELDFWRTSSLACDHCRAARRRAETFIVRATGSDPAIAAGTYKQVGRNCLEAFLGGKSAASIVASLGLPTMIREIGEGDGGWGGGEQAFEALELLSWAAASMRIAGYVSRKQAGESFEPIQSTSDHVVYLLTYPGNAMAAEKWHQARDKFAPSEDDKVRAADALAYAKGLTGSSDYEQNLRLIADQKVLERSHVGIMCSALQAYARYLGEQLKRSQRGTSEHIGTVGQKGFTAAVVCERVNTIDSNFGPMHIITLRDPTGNALVWRTGTEAPSVGTTYNLKGSIKAHTEFRGEKQTEVTRCKLEKV